MTKDDAIKAIEWFHGPVYGPYEKGFNAGLRQAIEAIRAMPDDVYTGKFEAETAKDYRELNMMLAEKRGYIFEHGDLPEKA
jgi:hypothetical protein